MRCFFFATVVLTILSFNCCFAEPVKTEHVTAELTLENNSLQPGATGPEANWLGLRLEMVPEWHTYWRFPGDTGLATKVKWKLPAGWKVSDSLWQLPRRIVLPPLVNFGYEDEALIGFQLQIPAGTPEGEQTIGASASWLVCKEECIPEKAELSLKVRVAKAVPKANPWANLFGNLRKQAPRAGVFSARLEDKGADLLLEIPGTGISESANLDFFPLESGPVKGDQAPKVERSQSGIQLHLDKNGQGAGAKNLAGLLVVQQGGSEEVHELNLPLPANLSGAPAQVNSASGTGPESGQGPRENSSAWFLVLLAFAGGLVLNLMPCVFPVLGIKVMSIVKQSGSQRKHARDHGHVYSLGVLVSFWALAAVLLVLRAAGEAAGWGFQLQHPGFVTVLILLFSFIAADLAGFIQWGGSWMGAGANLANKEGYAGSFFTGMLAVVVATPCTAPFMGTAIGAAFSQPSWVVLLVFTSLGLGLALPFLLLCYQPGFLSFLPRPGVWMERLKQFFAFPMAATVLWLLWVLSLQVGADATLKVELGLLLVVLSVWLRHQFRQGPAWILAWLLLGLGAAMAGSVASAPRADKVVQNSGNWQPYSEGALEDALKAGKPVFVDFTAAWCLTCQINRKLVLERAALQDYLKEKGVVLLLADWTNHDPAITKALERQGRIGVPLYLAYPAGSRQAQILPQMLTDTQLREFFR
jgi:thiol:disulfide interchange protein/DsbC/DsbD-like thiol-disulfide interchange protein